MIDSKKLNSTEQIFEVLNRVACSSNVVLISRIKGPQTEEILRQAFLLVQYRHSRLNYRIVGFLDSLHFETEGLAKIPFRVVYKPHSDQWQEVVLEELNEKIDSSKSLIRSVFLRPGNDRNISYLITTLHHGITDVSSNIRLHQDLLTYCQKIASGEPIDNASSLPILPSLEALLPETIKGFRGKMKGLLFLLQSGLKQLWYRPKTLGFETCLPFELRRTGLVHRELNEEFTQKLVNSCRNEKATIQGALCAAMMLTAARKIRAGKIKDISVSCCSTVDVRKLLEPVVRKEQMAMLSSFLASYHTIKTDTSFWELARDVKQQLESGLLRGTPLSQLLMASRKMIDNFLSNPNLSAWTVTIGNARADIPRVYGSFELEEINLAMASAAYGGVFYAGIVNFAGKIFLNFFFSDPSISRETMENLANSVVSYLVDACQKEIVPGLSL